MNHEAKHAESSAIADDENRVPAVIVDKRKIQLTPASEVKKIRSRGLPDWELLTVLQPGKGLRFLYLFSGPDNRPDGINTYCEALGASVDCFDKRYIDERKHDLVDEDNWEVVNGKLTKKIYHGGVASPPCRSMSELRERSVRDGGPRVVRGPEPPDLYGLPNLDPEEKDLVRCDNMLFCRSGCMARSFLDCGYVMRKGAKVWLPWLLEQPLRKEGKPHAFNLKWILPLHDHEAVSDEDIAQCNAGAATTKPTSLRATFKTGIDPDCKHPCRWWTIPWSGHS